MTIIDPIGDMFTRIRNAIKAKHDDVRFPFSKQRLALTKILKEEGYIKHYEIINEDAKKRFIRIILKYTQEGQTVITSIKRISKCGKRMYIKKSEIPKVLNGYGVNFVSTSKGIMTGRNARINNVGGELIGEIY